MAQRQQAGTDPERRQEAEKLAREAVEEFEHGNKDEGKFLAGEARELDPNAADAVLKAEQQRPAAATKSGAKAESAENRKSGSSGAKRSERQSATSAKRGTAAHEKRGGSAERTIDHDRIRAWVEERNGRPSVVKSSHDTAEGGGILRIDFNEPEQSLEEVPWDEFFETFEDRKLAFLHQDRTAGGELSRFFKFVSRDAEDEEGEGRAG